MQLQPIPSDDECILRLVSAGQSGHTLLYALLLDGSETRQICVPDSSSGRAGYSRSMKTEKIDLEAFWPQFNPAIDKVIEEDRNGTSHFTSGMLMHTGGCTMEFFVRSHLGRVGRARLRTSSQIQRNSIASNRAGPTPDYFVDLYDYMTPAETRPMPYQPPPPKSPREDGKCSLM